MTKVDILINNGTVHYGNICRIRMVLLGKYCSKRTFDHTCDILNATTGEVLYTMKKGKVVYKAPSRNAFFNYDEAE